MFSDLFIDRPKLATVISLVIMLAGVLCLFQLPVAEYPEVTPPQVMVQASYPGASAQVVADTVAAPIEAAVNGVENMIYFSSKSDNTGNYSLSITFESGCDSNMAQVNVQNSVKIAEPTLPEEVKALGVTTRKRSNDILSVFVFSSSDNSISALDLSNYVSRNVKDAIARVHGVSEAMIFGEREYSMRIWLNPDRMNSMKITPAEIASAIRNQNIQAVVGSVGTDESSNVMQFKIDTLGRLQSTKDFGKIILKTDPTGKIVRLSDVARIELGSSTYSASSFFNGKSSVALAVFRNNTANANKVVEDVSACVKELSKNFPKGMTYTISYDPTAFIRTTMWEIVETLILTLILVVAITYLFIQDWRATLIPTAVIPVSLIGTFAVLLAAGFSINVLTMFALILVIGSVVDDAIIVVENVARLMADEKLSPREASLKSMHQIGPAIVATTLVTLAVYAPLGFYGGMVGIIYRQFAVTMCTALLISMLCAFTLSPALCALILKNGEQKVPRLFAPFNIGLNASKNMYLSVVRILVRHGFVTILLFSLVLLGNYLLFNRVPNSFLPDEDKGAFFSSIQLAPGAPLAKTERVALDYSDKLMQIPGVNSVTTISGFSLIAGNGENVALIIATLDDWSQRKEKSRSIDAIMGKAKAIASKDPIARIDNFKPPAIMGLGAAGGVSFVIQATGSQTPQELYRTTQVFTRSLMAQPETLYAFSTFDANSPELFLNIDREKAAVMKVPVSKIFTTLQSNMASLYVNDFNLAGNTYKVKVQADASFRRDYNDLDRIYVTSDTGKLIPLSAFVKIERRVGPSQIERFNQFMSASVNAMAKMGVSSGTLMNRIDKLAQEQLTNAGYRIAWTDMSYQERGNEGKIVLLMMLALIFGYLFLVGQYESWIIPVPVILSVSTATGGALIALLVLGMPLSIYAQLGLVMLVGISSKNAILIVEFARDRRAAGDSISEASSYAFSARYRPVLMTAWSFILGIFPMVIASGAGAGSRQSLGVTTFYGMLIATILGIVFISPLYALFQRMTERFAAFVSGKKQIGDESK